MGWQVLHGVVAAWVGLPYSMVASLRAPQKVFVDGMLRVSIMKEKRCICVR